MRSTGNGPRPGRHRRVDRGQRRGDRRGDGAGDRRGQAHLLIGTVLALALTGISIAGLAAGPTGAYAAGGPIIAGSLGGRIWSDTGPGADTNNGVFDPGETAEPGVTVNLVNNSESTIDSTTTDVNGYYRFDHVIGGTYTVHLPASDFAVGGPLAGASSSGGADATFATSDNNHDHGVDAPDPQLTGVTSTPVTLGVNNPLGEADPGATGAGANGPGGDASDNLTADLGFVTDFAVGNYVWLDSNGNGIQDPGESPVPGSVVTLFDADATTPALDFQGNPVAPVTTATGQTQLVLLTGADPDIDAGLVPVPPGPSPSATTSGSTRTATALRTRARHRSPGQPSPCSRPMARPHSPRSPPTQPATTYSTTCRPGPTSPSSPTRWGPATNSRLKRRRSTPRAIRTRT